MSEGIGFAHSGETRPKTVEAPAMFAAFSALALLIGSVMAIEGPPPQDAAASLAQTDGSAVYVVKNVDSGHPRR